MDIWLLPLIAGLGLSFITGPMGCFLVWRRMAYFGDALAHASLLGIAIGLALNINLTIALIIVCVLASMLLALVYHYDKLPMDSWLGLISYGALAFGLLALYASGAKVDPHSFLVGEILAVTLTDLWWILGCVAIGLGFIIFSWRPLLLFTLDQDLAQTTDSNVKVLQGVFLILLSLVVAVSLKIVGALLIPALLIIPAACARQVSSSPGGMVIASIFFSALMAPLGIWGSFQADLPTGPMMIASGIVLFGLSFILKNIQDSFSVSNNS